MSALGTRFVVQGNDRWPAWFVVDLDQPDHTTEPYRTREHAQTEADRLNQAHQQPASRPTNDGQGALFDHQEVRP